MENIPPRVTGSIVNTSSPVTNSVTSSPTATIVPLQSCPIAYGNVAVCIKENDPAATLVSTGLIEAADTRIKTSVGEDNVGIVIELIV